MIVRFKITAMKLHFQNIIFKFLELYSKYYVLYSLQYECNGNEEEATLFYKFSAQTAMTLMLKTVKT